jgi:hypothetical protein
MKNCFDDDKLISRKRHRPLQTSEVEQSVSSEKKKEIFVIKYDRNDSIERTQKRRINGATSKHLALEKNQIVLTKEKGKENIRRRKKTEVNFKRIKFRPTQLKKNKFLKKIRRSPNKQKNRRMIKFWITINF